MENKTTTQTSNSNDSLKIELIPQNKALSHDSEHKMPVAITISTMGLIQKLAPIDFVIVFDISTSMGMTDEKISRIVNIKLTIKQMLEALLNSSSKNIYRVHLIAFNE